MNEEKWQTTVVKIINELLANKERFLTTLQKNIATILNEKMIMPPNLTPCRDAGCFSYYFYKSTQFIILVFTKYKLV